METETTTRPSPFNLRDSVTLPGSVALDHRQYGRGKATAMALLTRDDLRAIVQQAHDVYGITADPFATPGSADA